MCLVYKQYRNPHKVGFSALQERASLLHKIIEIHKILTLNDYINAERSNKYKAAKLKKEYTELFAREFTDERITNPVDVHFIWHLKNKRRDIDNISFMQKFILDGMVKQER